MVEEFCVQRPMQRLVSQTLSFPAPLADTIQQSQEISMGEILVLEDNYSKLPPTAKLSRPLSGVKASFPTNTGWSH